MKFLEGADAEEAQTFFMAAAKCAEKATCRKSYCGSVIVSGGEIIGEGYNSPAGELEENRTCEAVYTSTKKPLFDKTCCIHAEWRAILDACKRNPEKIPGSRLYFMRIDDQGNVLKSGEPYCTVCSRLTLEAGIAEFALWQEKGMAVWDAAEYDRASYAYFTDNQTN